MYLQVLIPTFEKTKEQLLLLCDSLNLQTDALIANQNGEKEEYSFEFRGHTVQVICTDTIGVSINRNILLKNSSGILNIMLDDDCRLVDNYEKIVISFFDKFSCDFALFNGIYKKENDRLVHNKKTKRIHYFFQVSYGGGPGFCFKKDKLLMLNLSYNEKVGTPNYVCAGEDSLFYFGLVTKKVNFVRSSVVLFEILNSKDASSYFSGVNEQYVTTRGFIIKKIHPNLFLLYKIKHCLRFKKENRSLKLKNLFKWFDNGKKLLRSSNESTIH